MIKIELFPATLKPCFPLLKQRAPTNPPANFLIPLFSRIYRLPSSASAIAINLLTVFQFLPVEEH
jgi:hypothetical protein